MFSYSIGPTPFFILFTYIIIQQKRTTTKKISMCVSIEVDISCICSKIYIFEEEIIKSTLLFIYVLLFERKRKKINCKSFFEAKRKIHII